MGRWSGFCMMQKILKPITKIMGAIFMAITMKGPISTTSTVSTIKIRKIILRTDEEDDTDRPKHLHLRDCASQRNDLSRQFLLLPCRAFLPIGFSLLNPVHWEQKQ